MSNALRTVNLLIDITSGKRIRDVRSRTFISAPSWTRNDSYLLNISLVTPQENDASGVVWRYVEIPDSIVRAAWGQIGLPPEAGEWRLYDPDTTSYTSYLSANASAEDVQIAVRGLAGYASATVSGDLRAGYIINRGSAGVVTELEVDTGQLSPRAFADVVVIQQGSSQVPQILAVYLEQQPAAYGNAFSPMPPAGSVIHEVQAGGSGNNAIYRITLDPEPYAGTFRVGFTTPAGSGFSTSIDYNADPEPFIEALVAMANVGEGNVSVRRSGASNSQWDIEFTGELANTPISGFSLDVASLLVPVGVTGLLNFGDTAVKELLRTRGSGNAVTGIFEVEIKPVLGHPITPYRQGGSIVYDDLIRGDQTVPAPKDSYPTTPEMQSYVTGQVDGLREEIDVDLADKADIDLGNVNPVIGRNALGLGDSATRDVGTTENTVAAGDDPRIVGALQPGDNVSALTNDAGYIPDTQKGANSGVATLDAGGKVPASQLPNSVMEYHGNWNAGTNTPTLVNGTGNAGDTYRCSVAGSVNFGAGAISFNVGDFVIYSGTIWERSINSNEVVSVNGKKGVVTGLVESVGGQLPNGSGAIATIPEVAIRKTLPGSGVRALTFEIDGTTSIRTVDSGATANSLAFRGTGGTLAVGAATANAHAVRKQEFDSALAAVVKSVGGVLPDENGDVTGIPLSDTTIGAQSLTYTELFQVPVYRNVAPYDLVGRISIGRNSMAEGYLAVRTTSGHIVLPTTDPTNDRWAASKGYVDNSMPIGSGMDYFGTTLPSDKFLWANGQAVSRTTYATLFARLGTRYGAGNGSTTFNLPDKRERVTIAAADMGGTTSQALIDKTVNGLNTETVGAVGGVGQVELTADQNGEHDHELYLDEDGILGLSENSSGGGQTYASGGRKTISLGPNTQNSGSGDPHANVQPTLVCNYIVKAL